MPERKRKKILFVFGTRPEAVKLAPLIWRMRSDSRFNPRIAVTGQHKEMLEQVMKVFRLKAHHSLAIMKKNQDLFDVTSKGLTALRAVMAKEKPDMVVVQGDTTSTLVGTLAAYYSRVPVGYVESGLRSDNKYNPFPEEVNRRMTTHAADLHFAPTAQARENLLREGISAKSIKVTGNTAVDAILYMKEDILRKDSGMLRNRYAFTRNNNPVLLVTAHRRESFGEGIRDICKALREIAVKNRNAELVYPVHLNPNVRSHVMRILGGHSNIHLLEPLPYRDFVYLMMHSHIILTDSGGIVEEAPSLGKPVLIMRELTERPEAVYTGAAKLVGTSRSSIVMAVTSLMNDSKAYKAMASSKNPYGDGKASERITRETARYFRAPRSNK